MFYYGSRISDNITKTPEGYLICMNVPINRVGSQTYKAYELGIDNVNPNEDITVYREPEDVFSKETLASFEGKPVTNNHPSEDVTIENNSFYDVGHGQNIRQDGQYTYADLYITDPRTISDIENGKKEISCGYNCDFVEENGKIYQKNIRGNHIAIVDNGRAGSMVSIKDSKVEDDNQPVEDDKYMEELKRKMSTLPNVVAIERLEKEIKRDYQAGILNSSQKDILLSKLDEIYKNKLKDNKVEDDVMQNEKGYVIYKRFENDIQKASGDYNDLLLIAQTLINFKNDMHILLYQRLKKQLDKELEKAKMIKDSIGNLYKAVNDLSMIVGRTIDATEKIAQIEELRDIAKAKYFLNAYEMRLFNDDIERELRNLKGESIMAKGGIADSKPTIKDSIMGVDEIRTFSRLTTLNGMDFTKNDIMRLRNDVDQTKSWYLDKIKELDKIRELTRNFNFTKAPRDSKIKDTIKNLFKPYKQKVKDMSIPYQEATIRSLEANNKEHFSNIQLEELERMYNKYKNELWKYDKEYQDKINPYLKEMYKAIFIRKQLLK